MDIDTCLRNVLCRDRLSQGHRLIGGGGGGGTSSRLVLS
jgi:hypothetical protein